MNQKQRNYLVKELKDVRDAKVYNIKKDSDINEDDFAKIVKAIKEGRLTQGESDRAINSNIRHMLSKEKMTLLIKRSLGHLSDDGTFYVKQGNLIKVIKEISADSWNTNKGYRANIHSIIEDIKHEAKEDFISVIGDKTSDSKTRLSALETYYKDAERKVMLANSEEMIEAITKFEEKIF